MIFDLNLFICNIYDTRNAVGSERFLKNLNDRRHYVDRPAEGWNDISAHTAPAAVREIVAEHQQGKSDFFTFCELVARAGVEKWVVDTRNISCTYYDLGGNEMLADPIPYPDR